MKNRIKRALFMAAGTIFIPVGIAGLALPFLQGFLLIIIGIILLSISSQSFRRWIEQYTRPHPHLHAFVERTERWIVKIVGSPDAA